MLKQYADAHYNMMISDLNKNLEYEKGVFVSVMHVAPVSQNISGRDDDTGLELYRRVFEWVIKDGKYEFCTPFQIDIDEMWERARPAKIANVEVLVLSSEDLILHLCLHASFQHKFRLAGIRYICDISETIQHYQDEIDWKQFLSIANEYGISKYIYCTLCLTKEMLGTEIPDYVLTELKPDTFDPQLINLAEERILSKTSSQVAPSFVDAFSPEKLIDKLKVTLKHLFPPRSSVATRFPVSENSIFLYPFYLVYPFNFIKRRWPFLWRLTKRDKAILSEFKQAVAQKRRAEILERWLSSYTNLHSIK